MNNKGRRSSYPKSKTSMTRSRRTYSRRSEAEQESNLLESVIMQCIVCGIILTLAMLICVIKTPTTIALRQNLKTALSDNISGETAANSPTSIMGLAKNAVDSVKYALGLAEKPQNTDNGNAETATPVFSSTDKETNFRIDEDILETLNGSDTLIYQGTGEADEKKSLVP